MSDALAIAVMTVIVLLGLSPWILGWWERRQEGKRLRRLKSEQVEEMLRRDEVRAQEQAAWKADMRRWANRKMHQRLDE